MGPAGGGAGAVVVAGGGGAVVAVVVETARCDSPPGRTTRSATTTPSKTSPDPTSRCGRRPRTLTGPTLPGTLCRRDARPLHLRRPARGQRQRVCPRGRLHRAGGRAPARPRAVP